MDARCQPDRHKGNARACQGARAYNPRDPLFAASCGKTNTIAHGVFGHFPEGGSVRVVFPPFRRVRMAEKSTGEKRSCSGAMKSPEKSTEKSYWRNFREILLRNSTGEIYWRKLNDGSPSLPPIHKNPSPGTSLRPASETSLRPVAPTDYALGGERSRGK